MKGVIVSSKEEKRERSPFFSGIINYVLIPFQSGIVGFALFFTVLISAKYLGFLIGSVKGFYVDVEDVILSLLGFVLVFLIKFLNNFKEKESKK